jgi:hypothetical protein
VQCAPGAGLLADDQGRVFAGDGQQSDG